MVDGLEKGLAFDEENGLFRLLNKDTDKLAVLKAKPAAWKWWSVRFLTAIGGVTVIGCIGFTAMHLTRQVSTKPATATVAVMPAQDLQRSTAPRTQDERKDEPEAAPKSTGQAPASTTPKPLTPAPTGPTSGSVATASKAQSVPVQRNQMPPAASLPLAPSPNAPRPVEAPASAKPAIEPTKPALAVATKAPTQEPIQKASTPNSAGAVAAPAKVWAVRVEQNGVTFSASNKLFRVGEMLPSGELLVDVDAATATYVTDKGLRQVRSTAITR